MPLLPRLDRDGEVVVAEAEAQEQVGDRLPHPIGGDEVHRVEPAQVEGLVVVAGRELRLCPIVEIPDVMHGHEVALERRVGQLGDLGLPVSVVRALDREPPAEQDRKENRKARRREPAGPRQEERHEGCQPDDGEGRRQGHAEDD